MQSTSPTHSRISLLILIRHPIRNGEKRKISKALKPYFVLFSAWKTHNCPGTRPQHGRVSDTLLNKRTNSFLPGWDKYHDRFFTRCYVQEGEAAYDQAIKAQQKNVDSHPVADDDQSVAVLTQNLQSHPHFSASIPQYDECEQARNTLSKARPDLPPRHVAAPVIQQTIRYFVLLRSHQSSKHLMCGQMLRDPSVR